VNLARLKGAFTKNRAAIAALGVVAVAAFAWVNRGEAGAGSTSSSADAAPGGYSTGAQTGAASGYDSSASDLYDAVQPQIEALDAMQKWLAENAKLPITPTVPVPATPVTPAKPITGPVLSQPGPITLKPTPVKPPWKLPTPLQRVLPPPFKSMPLPTPPKPTGLTR